MHTTTGTVPEFKTLADFYPYYLGEHRNPVCRALHFVGTSIALILFFGGILTGNVNWIYWIPLAGYGFAWIGHFFFEKNKPATFKFPRYSLICDFLMFRDLLTRRIGLKG